LCRYKFPDEGLQDRNISEKDEITQTNLRSKNSFEIYCDYEPVGGREDIH